MALAVSTTSETMKKFQRFPADTGSPEVQIALLTNRINELTEHLKIHKKDNHSRYGLQKMVSQRRSLMKYFKDQAPEIYSKLVADLGIRG